MLAEKGDFLLVELLSGANKNHGLVVPGVIYQYRTCLLNIISPKTPRTALL